MGLIVNTVKEIGIESDFISTDGKGFNQRKFSEFGEREHYNFEYGSQICSMVRECRDIGKGLAQGTAMPELLKVVLNAGVIALAVVELGRLGQGLLKSKKIGISKASRLMAAPIFSLNKSLSGRHLT